VVPFEPVGLSPQMHGGRESLSVVDDKKQAGLRIAKRKGAGKFDDLVATAAPLVAHAFSPSGRNRVRKDAARIGAEELAVQTVVTRGGKVNANNRKWLEKPAKRAEGIVSGFGRALKIPSLQRARQFLPISLGEKDVIKFVADPEKVGKGLYRSQFLKNMREQLREQQRGLRQLSADEWLAQRAKFSMDAKAFRAFDTAGREQVIKELHDRAVAAKARGNRFLKLLEKWIKDAEGKKKKSDEVYEKLEKWIEWLARAEQRRENAEEALRELKRASKGIIEVPDRDILKARYEKSTEVMRQRILGRQDQEKKVRAKHKKNLEGFLKQQADWSELAKTGSDLAILHRPDQVAGGYDRFEELPIPPGEVDLEDPRWKTYFAGLRKMFGPKKVNELIGTQWKGQIEKVVAPLKQAIGAPPAYPIHRMNLTLKIVPKEA